MRRWLMAAGLAFAVLVVVAVLVTRGGSGDDGPAAKGPGSGDVAGDATAQDLVVSPEGAAGAVAVVPAQFPSEFGARAVAGAVGGDGDRVVVELDGGPNDLVVLSQRLRDAGWAVEDRRDGTVGFDGFGWTGEASDRDGLVVVFERSGS